MPEIINVLRQAGKSSSRNDDVSKLPSGGGASSETGAPSLPTAPAAMAPADLVFSTTFARRFEVLFCGRVTVPHKNAPPALIDECIVKFSHLRHSGGSAGEGGFALRDGLKTLAVPANGLKSREGRDGWTGSPTAGRPPVSFKRDPSLPCLQALDENGLSPAISQAITTEAHLHLTGVQPSSPQENRTMLFMVML